jgi:hypothetical protein
VEGNVIEEGVLLSAGVGSTNAGGCLFSVVDVEDTGVCEVEAIVALVGVGANVRDRDVAFCLSVSGTVVLAVGVTVVCGAGDG